MPRAPGTTTLPAEPPSGIDRSIRLMELLGQASVGVAEARADGTLVACNEKLAEMYGLPRSKLVKGRLDDLVPTEERGRLNRRLRLIAAGGPPASLELRHIRPDGVRFWTNVQILPWAEGTDRLLVVVHDETHWKQVGRELKTRNDQLEERLGEQMREQETVIRELESFNYAVSHDLRTPLRAIRGFSELLLQRRQRKLEPETHQMLEYIFEGTRRMTDTVEGLLRLSRMSRQELRRQRTDLSGLVGQILAGLQRRPPKRRAKFLVQRGLFAQADPQMIEVVLQNLLENAWKFTRDRKETTIEFGSVERQGRLHYFIRDNGVGFDMADATQLFQPFRRLHRASEFEGTGIGLATVHRIIRRHGGRVEAEAKVGEGATFYFTLSRWENWG